jgi:hypothetical protein
VAVAGPSGGCSELDHVIPAKLLMQKIKEREHELWDSKVGLQYLPSRPVTFWKSLTTGRCSRQGVWPELGKRKGSRRLERVESPPRLALGSQGSGGGDVSSV